MTLNGAWWFIFNERGNCTASSMRVISECQ